jgi:hypothetical protein
VFSTVNLVFLIMIYEYHKFVALSKIFVDREGFL